MARRNVQRPSQWLDIDPLLTAAFFQVVQSAIALSTASAFSALAIMAMLCEVGLWYTGNTISRRILAIPIPFYTAHCENARKKELRVLALKKKGYRIPVELSIMIIDIIAKEEDMATLVALSCTCRVFQAEAERHIYRHIGPESSPKYKRAAYALVQQPSRWILVRSVTLCFDEYPPCIVNVVCRWLLRTLSGNCKNLVELKIRLGAELWLDEAFLAISSAFTLRSYKTMCSLEDGVVVAFLKLQPEIRNLWVATERPYPTSSRPIEPFDGTFLQRLVEFHGPAQQVHAIVPGRPLTRLEVTEGITESREEQRELWKAISTSSSTITYLKLNIECNLDTRLLEDVAGHLPSVRQLHLVARSADKYTMEDAISWVDGITGFPQLRRFEFTTELSHPAFQSRQAQHDVVEVWGKSPSLQEVIFNRRYMRDCWVFDGESWIDPSPPHFSFCLDILLS